VSARDALAVIRERADAATIPGFPGYEVDHGGRVWSTTNWRSLGRREITPTPGHGGYLKVRLSRPDGTRANRAVHRLVAQAFLGPRPAGMETRHLNGMETDNRAANLGWGTPVENAQDRDRHGTTAVGERNGQARLSEGSVHAIRSLAANGATQRSIAKAIGVSQRTVGRVLRGEGWTHV
jgi:hypothetical protein